MQQLSSDTPKQQISGVSNDKQITATNTNIQDIAAIDIASSSSVLSPDQVLRAPDSGASESTNNVVLKDSAASIVIQHCQAKAIYAKIELTVIGIDLQIITTQSTPEDILKRHLFNIPLKMPTLIPRLNLIQQIEKRFQPPATNKAARSKIAACVGLSGMGKSTLAVEYLYGHLDKYINVFWFEASNSNVLKACYVKLSQMLSFAFSSEAQAIQMLKEWFGNQANTLIIFNQAPNYEAIEAYVPQNGVDVLVTSIQSVWPEEEMVIKVEEFNFEQSKAYIQTMLEKPSGEPDDVLSQLALAFGNLPLGIAQACAYIKRCKINIPHYLALYQEHPVRILSGGDTRILPLDYQGKPILALWDAVIAEVARRSVCAVRLLYVCSWLHTTVPFSIAQVLAANPEINLNNEPVSEVLGWLSRYSFININSSAQVFTINSLLQRTICIKQTNTEKLIYLKIVLSFFTQHKDTPSSQSQNWKLQLETIIDNLMQWQKTCIEKDTIVLARDYTLPLLKLLQICYANDTGLTGNEARGKLENKILAINKFVSDYKVEERQAHTSHEYYVLMGKALASLSSQALADAAGSDQQLLHYLKCRIQYRSEVVLSTYVWHLMQTNEEEGMQTEFAEFPIAQCLQTFLFKEEVKKFVLPILVNRLQFVGIIIVKNDSPSHLEIRYFDPTGEHPAVGDNDKTTLSMIKMHLVEELVCAINRIKYYSSDKDCSDPIIGNVSKLSSRLINKLYPKELKPEQLTIIVSSCKQQFNASDSAYIIGETLADVCLDQLLSIQRTDSDHSGVQIQAIANARANFCDERIIGNKQSQLVIRYQLLSRIAKALTENAQCAQELREFIKYKDDGDVELDTRIFIVIKPLAQRMDIKDGLMLTPGVQLVEKIINYLLESSILNNVDNDALKKFCDCLLEAYLPAQGDVIFRLNNKWRKSVEVTNQLVATEKPRDRLALDSSEFVLQPATSPQLLAKSPLSQQDISMQQSTYNFEENKAAAAQSSVLIQHSNAGENIRASMNRTLNKLQLVKTMKDVLNDKKEHLTKLWNFPPRNPNFTGREALLRILAERFSSMQHGDMGQMVVLTPCHGLGGVGKSQLAIEYAFRQCAAYDAVIWISAENADHIKAAYAELAQDLCIAPEQAKIDEIIYRVKMWLLTHPRYLLVFDNAPNYQSIKDYLPQTAGHVLITSRFSNWLEKSIEVDVFMPEEARDFAIKILGRRQGDSEKSIDELSEMLGRLPLALAQAVAYIKQNNISIKEYMALFQQRKAYLLSKEMLPAGNHHAAVFVTWDVTMQLLQHTSSIVQKLLYLCAYLYKEQIPIYLIKYCAQQYLNANDKMITEETLGILDAYSMLKINSVNNTVIIHQLVQEVIQEGLKLPQDRGLQKATLDMLINGLNDCGPDVSDVIQQEKCRQALQPHIESVVNHYEKLVPHDTWSLNFAILLGALGVRYSETGDNDKQVGCFGQQIDILLKHFPKDSVELSRPLTNQANGQLQLGRSKEARDNYLWALGIAENKLGKMDKQVAIILASLGRATLDLGDIKLAKQYLDRAYDIFMTMTTSGSTYQIICGNLALSYLKLNIEIQNDEAFQRGLTLCNRYKSLLSEKYGVKHPSYAGVLKTLAEAYGTHQVTANIEQAEKLLHEALVILKDFYGEEHPAVAEIYVAIVNINPKRERNDGLALLTRADAILHKSAEMTQSKLIDVLNLAIAYHRIGKVDRSIELLENALVYVETSKGKEHHAVPQLLMHLSRAYLKNNNLTKCRDLQLRALQINEIHYGERHPSSLYILNDLAVTQGLLRNYDAQLKLLDKAFAICQSSFGNSHRTVVDNLKKQVKALKNAKQFEEAIKKQLSIIEMIEGTEGPESLSLAQQCRKLAKLYAADKKYLEAIACYTRQIHIYQNVRDIDPNEIAEAYFNLGRCLIDANALRSEAQENFEMALALFAEDNYKRYNCMTELVNIHIAQKEYGQARVLLLQALPYTQKEYDETKRPMAVFFMADLYLKLAIIHNHSAEYLHAIEQCEVAQKKLALLNEHAEDHPIVIIKLNEVRGYAHKKLQQFIEARRYYEKALSVLAANVGQFELMLLPKLMHLASICLALQDYVSAKETLAHILLILEMHPFPKKSLNISELFNNLFENLQCEPLNTNNAISILHQKLLSTLKDNHVAIGALRLVILMLIGNAYLEINNQGAAKKILIEIVNDKDKMFGIYHEETVRNLVKLSVISLNLNDYHGQVSYLERAYAIKKHHGHEHDDQCDHLKFLIGQAHGQLGNIKGASDAFEECLMIQAEHYPPDHPEILKTLESIADISQSMQDKKAAKEYLERALPLYERSYGTYHHKVASLLGRLGDLCSALKDRKKAITYYSNAIEIHRKTSTDNTMAYVNLLCSMALLYGPLNDLRMQKKLLKSAVQIMMTLGATSTTDFINNLNSLGKAYADLNKKEKAKKIHEQALLVCDAIGDDRLPIRGLVLTNVATSLRECGEYRESLEKFMMARRHLLSFGRTNSVRERILSVIEWSLPLVLSELRPEECARYEQELLSGHDDDTKTLTLMGNVYFKRALLKEAIYYYEIVVALNPHANCLGSLACCYDANSESVKAAEMFLKHLANPNATSSAYADYSLCLFRQKKYPEAINASQEALKRWDINHDDAPMMSYDRAERPRLDEKLQCVLDLEENILIYAHHFACYILFNSYTAMDDYVEQAVCLEEFERRIQTAAVKNALSYLLLGFCYESVGDDNKAKECFENAGELLEDDKRSIIQRNITKLSTAHLLPINSMLGKYNIQAPTGIGVKNNRKNKSANQLQTFINTTLVPTFFLPTERNQYRILTLDDGNCAFNGIALGICDHALLDQLIYHQRFYELLQTTCHLEAPTQMAFKAWLVGTGDEKTWQKHVALACRTFAVEEMRKNYMIIRESVEELLWTAFLLYKDDPLGNADDMFIVHKHIAQYFSGPDINREKLIGWWNDQGKEQYFNNILQSSSFNLEKSRWGSEIEMSVIACALKLNITWLKAHGSQQLGIGGGLIALHQLDDKAIRELTEHNIGQKYLGYFRLFPFHSHQQLNEDLTVVDEVIAAKIIHLITQNKHPLFPEHIEGISNITQLIRMLETRNVVTRRNDKKYYFVTTPDGSIDQEAIIRRLNAIDVELARLVNQHFVLQPVGFSMLFEENHWTYLRDSAIALQLAHQTRQLRWSKNVPQQTSVLAATAKPSSTSAGNVVNEMHPNSMRP